MYQDYLELSALIRMVDSNQPFYSMGVELYKNRVLE